MALRPIYLFPLILISSILANSCPDGSTYLSTRQKCFSAVPVPLSYLNARLSCALFNGQLAKVDSLEEYETLFEHLEAKNVHGENLWLGGTKVNATWTWIDGEKLKFTNWDENEPTHPERDNCLLMNRESKFWKAENCDVKAHYVCEMDLEENLALESCPTAKPVTCPPCPTCAPEVTCPPVTECPICPTDAPSTTPKPKPNYPKCPWNSPAQDYIPDPKWRVYNGYQYGFWVLKKNFTAAEAGCQYFGGYLVSIHDKKEESFVESLILGNQAWIGGISSGDNSFCWTDTTQWNYTKLKGADEHACVKMVKQGSTYEWKREGCEESLGFVCKRRYWG